VKAPARRCRAVLFDLDGTLLDTAGDIHVAFNELLVEQCRAPVPYDQVRPQVSHGSVAIVRVGFADLPPDQFEARRERFMQLYLRRVAVLTRLFDGLEHALAAFEASGIPWGVVTNKPGFLTDPLLTQLGLSQRAACVISGDSLPERKPHPQPLLVAAALLDLPPSDCIYVGDAERDIIAARAAGMPSVLARFGYLRPEDQPDSWQADYSIERPEELVAWIEA
jgi:N-acetyl-D-muramate 6-phosphate phosphatase